MKSVKEWFETIQCPVIRQLAVERISNSGDTVSLASAICGGFDWQSSDEGLDFWSRIQYEFAVGNYQITFDSLKSLLKPGYKMPNNEIYYEIF